MAMTETLIRKAPKAVKLKLESGVLGVTPDGVKILKQGRSKHFTQKQALEIARKVVAARRAG